MDEGIMRLPKKSLGRSDGELSELEGSEVMPDVGGWRDLRPLGPDRNGLFSGGPVCLCESVEALWAWLSSPATLLLNLRPWRAVGAGRVDVLPGQGGPALAMGGLLPVSGKELLEAEFVVEAGFVEEFVVCVAARL